MLLRFSFENFRSFKGKTTLALVASSQTTLNDVLIRKGEKDSKSSYRLLPSAVIYGPNASGKSNVILAMQTLRGIVAQGSIVQSQLWPMANLELFPFVHGAAQRDDLSPISFEVDFITADGHHFLYTLTIEVALLGESTPRTITDEKLIRIRGKTAIELFHRKEDAIEIGDQAAEILGYNALEMLQLKTSVTQNMDAETLFLTGGFKSSIRKAVADRVIGYITDEILATTDFSKTLQTQSVTLEYKTQGEPINPDDDFVQLSLLDAFKSAADFGPQQIGFKSVDMPNKKRAWMMASVYKNVLIPAYSMESEGTIKLLNFVFALLAGFDGGKLLMIDEMDTAIHPELVKGIVALFGNPEFNKAGAQLVFTTHNPSYLDNKLLRRDQILFTERDPDTYESSLYSLKDFGSVNVRNDQSYMQNYFKGRYGRLPYIDFEALLAHEMGA